MPKVKRGLFVTLEGGEGTGKSTLLSGLAKVITSQGISLVKTREPGGTLLAESVRALALHPPDGQQWSPIAQALLMNAARASHVEDLLRPALCNGSWVLSDRFSDSTLAYQSIGGVPMHILRMLEAAVLADTVPDITLILDAPPSALIDRRRSRGETLDIFETKPLEFHIAVRESFLAIAKQNAERYIVLDALKPAEDVLAEAWAAVNARASMSESAR